MMGAFERALPACARVEAIPAPPPCPFRLSQRTLESVAWRARFRGRTFGQCERYQGKLARVQRRNHGFLRRVAAKRPSESSANPPAEAGPAPPLPLKGVHRKPYRARIGRESSKGFWPWRRARNRCNSPTL